MTPVGILIMPPPIIWHMTPDLADFQDAENLTRCQHPQDSIILADKDGSSILTGVKDGPSTIMVGRFISHNLYKVDLSEDLDMESNKPANVKIQTCVMTASTSKSATNLASTICTLEWSISQTTPRPSYGNGHFGVKVRKTSFLWGLRKIKNNSATPSRAKKPSDTTRIPLPRRCWRGLKTYTTFRGFRYFILFDCDTASHVWVRFLKKKSKASPAFQNLVTFIYRQYGIKYVSCTLTSENSTRT